MAPCGQCYFEEEKRRSILCLIFWRVKNPLSFLLILFNHAWVQEEATCPFCGYLRRRQLWETGWRMQRSLSKDSHLGKDVSGNDMLLFTPWVHKIFAFQLLCTCPTCLNGQVYMQIFEGDHSILLFFFKRTLHLDFVSTSTTEERTCLPSWR